MANIVVFRADGNSEIGLGHFTRCLAMADMLKKDFNCVFSLSDPGAHQISSLNKAGFGLNTLPAGADHYPAFLDTLTGEEIVVLDNYFFDTIYQDEIKKKGCKLVCISDIPDRYFKADVVINHGGGISKEEYSVEAYTSLFLGPQYSLLRKEFFEPNTLQQIDSENNLFISLGGADPQNITLEVLKEISLKWNYHNVYCVIGGANMHRDALEDFISGIDYNIHLLENLSAADMVNYMRKSAMAITAASTIAYEYLTVGGLLYVIKTADNQAKLYNYLVGNKLAFDYKKLEDGILPTTHTKELFDGASPERICKIFNSLSYASQFVLRRATEEDLLMIYDWINDDEVRAQSFSKGKITLDAHRSWFNNAITRPSTYYYILEDELSKQAVGQIRFEKEENEMLLNYLLAANARGRGLGNILVLKGIERVLTDTRESLNFTAFVKADNAPSNNIFKNLAFSTEPASEYANSNKYYYSIKNERV